MTVQLNDIELPGEPLRPYHPFMQDTYSVSPDDALFTLHIAIHAAHVPRGITCFHAATSQSCLAKDS